MSARLNLPLGQWVEMDGKLMRLVRRADDEDQRLVFERTDGVPREMTDDEFLDLQQNQQRLRLVSPQEAENLLKPGASQKPRVTFTPGDEASLGAETRRRLGYVRAWERAGRPSRTDALLGPIIAAHCAELRQTEAGAAEKPPSARSLNRWIAGWISSGGDIQSLVPQEANRGNCTCKLAPSAQSILESVVESRYLDSTRPTGVAVHAHVVRAFEEHNAALPEEDRLLVPSLNAVYRAVHAIDKFTLDYSRVGLRYARGKWAPKGSSPATLRHNEVWEVDHTTVDAIVVHETTGMPIGRPTVTTAVDRHTRMIPGFHIGFDPPGTFPVQEMLRSAIMPKNDILAAAKGVFGKWPCMGTPEILITDQGKEFKALTFTDGCLMLGIDVQYTPVLKPWLKGRVERFFRTLTTDVFQRVPGTTFSKFFDLRKEVIPEKVAVVTIDELRDHMLRFVVDVHNVRPHRVLRRSPLQEWESSVQQHGMRPLPDPETVVAALSNVAHRVPQHYGIEYEGLRYNSPEVAAYRIRPDAERERAVKIAVDPRDLTSIRFLDRATNRYVSVPILPGLLGRMRGITLEKHRLARALQRANMEALAGEAGLLRAYTLIDDAMRAKGTRDGRANRLSAARYWEKLTKARPPEDPPAFDTLASRSGVTDGLFGDVWAPQPVPEPPEAPRQARPAAPSATDAPAPDTSADTLAPGTTHAEDDVDLEAIARRLGMDGDGVS